MPLSLVELQLSLCNLRVDMLLSIRQLRVATIHVKLDTVRHGLSCYLPRPYSVERILSRRNLGVELLILRGVKLGCNS